MSAPVHYDVERTLADLRAGWARFRLRDDAEPCERIALAHRAVTAELIRMTLQSANSGHTEIQVLEAGQMLLADWLVFMTSVYEDDALRIRMATIFLSNTLKGVVARIRSGEPDQTTDVTGTPGGHA